MDKKKVFGFVADVLDSPPCGESPLKLFCEAATMVQETHHGMDGLQENNVT